MLGELGQYIGAVVGLTIVDGFGFVGVAEHPVQSNFTPATVNFVNTDGHKVTSLFGLQ